MKASKDENEKKKTDINFNCFLIISYWIEIKCKNYLNKIPY